MGAGGAARREDEGAGAEGRLGLPRREARLPDRRRLLVARHAADRDRAPEQVGDGGADGRGAAGNVGEQGPRYAKQVAQPPARSEEHTYALPSLKRTAYSGFCLKT